MHNNPYKSRRDFISPFSRLEGKVPNSSEGNRYEANDDFAYTVFSTIAAFVTQGLWC